MKFAVLAWLGATLAAAATAAVPEGAVPLKIFSAVAVSPDGRTVVFDWAQDLWTGPVDGGEAKRIVQHPARDSFPRFSPDGTRVFFSSDRSGSMQVHSVPVAGGEVERHSWHSEGQKLDCISADGRRALVRGMREAPGFLATRPLVIDLTGEQRERRLFDASVRGTAWSPDESQVLFSRGGELLFRKGYRGSRASQIWLYRQADRSFECMVAEDADARSPMWRPDGKGFYYVSDRDGTGNLWLRNEDGKDQQLTNFDDDGVITPDLSADGSVMVFRRGKELFRYRPGTDEPAAAIEFWTRDPLPDVSVEHRRVRSAASADFTRDLRQVVVSAAGDLWLVPGNDRDAVRLTDTSEGEHDVCFSPDGEWLYFLRDDGLSANYFRARLTGGRLAGEQQVTQGEVSKGRLKPSPDGSRIAWIEGAGDIWTAAADGAGARCVYPCWDKPTFDWSPDGRWLAIAAEDRNSNRDILVVPADGSGKPVNLTRHPAFEGSPRWSPDGRMLVFNAKRDQTGESSLWCIDFTTDDPTAGHTERRISTRGIEPTRVLWAPDSKSLIFQSTDKEHGKTYRIGADGKGMETLTKRQGIPIRMAADGSLLWRAKGTPEVITAKTQVRFPVSLTATRARADILRLGFRRVWRTLRERYYDPTMNGHDWDAIRLKYEELACEARDSRQFDQVISWLRGELNASHLGFAPKAWPGESSPKPAAESATGHPGLMFEDHDARPDAPLRIRRVIAGTPVSLLPDPPLPGETIIRIDDQPVTNGYPLQRIFNGAVGRRLTAVVRATDGRERSIELPCISYSDLRALVTRERETEAAARTEAALPGTTYLRVPDMSATTLRRLMLQIYRASLESERLVLDLRNNIGGREADRLLGMFCQPEHSHTIPRGGPRGYPVDRRPLPSWSGPVVVLCNENTFSNAEVFCHAIQHIDRAPLVGIATAGGVISAVKTTIPDVGRLQVPFRGWYDIATGANYDIRGAQPDHPVPLTPEDEEHHRDPQLRKALEVLKALEVPEHRSR
ncbi:MAG: S41 family peptidase [Verrucomicrobiota bacterium JB025]|nr:S41 family peptidase [Verrucomicrobiota bacterium JB025]